MKQQKKERLESEEQKMNKSIGNLLMAFVFILAFAILNVWKTLPFKIIKWICLGLVFFFFVRMKIINSK